VSARTADRVEATYLGFRLLIGERTVTVLTPNRRLVCEVGALSTARACVRAYRRATPADSADKAKSRSALPAESARPGSDREDGT
jgi:hypothetical protein